MRLLSSVILFLCLVVCFSSVSCAGMPSGSMKTAPSSDQPVTVNPVMAPAAVTSPVSSVAPDTPPVTQSDAQQPIDQTISGKTEPPPIEEKNTVEAVVPDISVPPGEKLLYFYPEPDFQFIAPVKPIETSASTPVPAIVAPVSAVSSGIVTKPATTPAVKPAVKTEATGKKTDVPAVVEKPVDNVLPGIWESEIVAPAQNAISTVPTISPSRKVTVAKGQTLEVWYPGSGWVYLGDVSAQNGLSYETRKLDNTNTLFTFKALKPGDYLLEFSRFDVLEDSFLSDALAVTVTDSTDTRLNKVRAPIIEALRHQRVSPRPRRTLLRLPRTQPRQAPLAALLPHQPSFLTNLP